ncbi:hypothetical protein EJB05_19117, partial [Eragrostis curvula]
MESAAASSSAAPPVAAVRGRCIVRIRLPRAWTAEEDARLECLAKESGFRHWHRVARRMPGRSSRQCRDRWRHHLARDVYHRPFTARDDEELRRLVARFGNRGRWKDIGRAVYGRTSRVMKHRWKEIRNNHHHRGVAGKTNHPLDLLVGQEDEITMDDDDDHYSCQTEEAASTTSYADDVLASSFVSCSLSSCDDDAMDPRTGSLALGFACMAV